MKRLQIAVEFVNCRKWTIDEATGAGLELTIRERKGYDIVEIQTTNRIGSPDRVEDFKFLRLHKKAMPMWREKMLRRAVTRAFGKIAHRYREWGVPEEKIHFPWREEKSVG